MSPVKPEEQALLELPARRVDALLDRLLELRQHSKDDPEIENPRVTLLLQSGHRLSGWIVAQSQDTRGRVLLVWETGADPRQPEDNALYVDVSSIEAVLVHHASRIAHLLSGDVTKRPPAAAPMTRLELRRKIETWRAALATLASPIPDWQLDWDSLPSSTDELWVTHDAIKEVHIALMRVFRSPLGPTAFAEKYEAVRFAIGSPPSLTAAGRTILVTFDPKGSGAGACLDRERSFGALNQLL